MKKQKLTLGALRNSVDSLQYLADLELTVQASFWLGKMLASANIELEEYRKQVQRLSDKHNRTFDGPLAIFPTDKAQDAFIADMDQLDATEIEIQVHKLRVEELGVDKLKPIVFMYVGWLFYAPSENGQE